VPFDYRGARLAATTTQATGSIAGDLRQTASEGSHTWLWADDEPRRHKGKDRRLRSHRHPRPLALW